MYRIFVFLLVLASTISAPSFAQKSTAKKEKTWQDQVLGDWILDSLVLQEGGRRMHGPGPMDQMQGSTVRLLPCGKVALMVGGKNFLRRGRVMTSGYDLLTGKKGNYINLEMAMNMSMQVEIVSEKILKLQFKGPYISRDFGAYFHFSKSTFPQDELVKNLEGSFYKEKKYSYFAENNENPIPDTVAPAETEPRLLFVLGPDGQMGNYLGAVKDTGTWVLNPEDLTLELKGKRTTQKLDILSWECGGSMILRPAGVPEDSFLRLVHRVEETHFPFTDDSLVDTTVRYDSIAVTAPTDSEYEGLSTEEMMLCRSWKAVNFGPPDTKLERDTFDRPVRLNLMKDGTFTFMDGKKKYQGKWRSVPNDGRLVLTMKGREQLANYELDYNPSPTGHNTGYYPEDMAPWLVISFIPPKSKTVVTFTFERQK